MLNQAERDRSILLIGSTSVIGDALAVELADLGRVKTAGRRNADITFDLANPAALGAVDEAFDTAVLVGADFGGPTDEDFIRAELINAVGALTACRLAHRAGVKHLVLISSISANYKPGDAYYDMYSLSKRHGEEVAAFYCDQRNIALTIIRPTGVYDTEGRCRNHQGLLYAIVDHALSGSDFTIDGSADPERNFIHLADLAQVVKRVIMTELTGSYVCAHPHSITVSRMTTLAFEVFGRGGHVTYDGSKRNITELGNIPASDLYERLAFWPLVSLAEGFRRIKDFKTAELGS